VAIFINSVLLVGLVRVVKTDEMKFGSRKQVVTCLLADWRQYIVLSLERLD